MQEQVLKFAIDTKKVDQKIRGSLRNERIYYKGYI